MKTDSGELRGGIKGPRNRINKKTKTKPPPPPPHPNKPNTPPPKKKRPNSPPHPKTHTPPPHPPTSPKTPLPPPHQPPLPNPPRGSNGPASLGHNGKGRKKGGVKLLSSRLPGETRVSGKGGKKGGGKKYQRSRRPFQNLGGGETQRFPRRAEGGGRTCCCLKTKGLKKTNKSRTPRKALLNYGGP